MRCRLLTVTAVALALFFTGGWLPMASAETAPEGQQEAPPRPTDPRGRETPQGAVTGYLEATADQDYTRAAEYLDLTGMPRGRRARDGAELARQLKRALDRRGFLDRWSVSSDPAGTSDDGLPPDRERVGVFRADGQRLDIVLVRVPESDGAPVWKFSAETVSNAGEVAAGIQSSPIEELLPDRLVEISVLDVALWQWMALGLVVALAAALSWLLVRAIRLATRLLRPTERADQWQRVVDRSAGPVRLLLAVAIFGMGTTALGISIVVRQYLGRAVEVVAVAALTWLVLRIIEVLTEAATRTLTARGQTSVLAVMPLGRRAVKAALLAVGVITVLSSVGVNVTPALTALGVGGLAVALAAQKTVENLFGGVTLVADQPVRVGDFCRFGEKVGIVEDIGMRSTRIRTLDRTVLTVPNGDFSSLQIENFGRRDRFWFHPMIGVRYETTPDQIRVLLVEIRALLYAHPRMGPGPRVRFIGFGQSSLNLEVFSYVQAVDFDEFLEIQEDLLLRIMEIVDKAGSAIAFPSQTLYLASDSGPSAEARAAAAATVQEWRDRSELQLPRFTPARIERLRATLPYPPPGSAIAKAD